MKMFDRSVVFAEHVLGSSQAETPEGFLLCKEVCIARIGTQDYLNEELIDPADENPLVGGTDGIIHVERRAEDVFDPNTLASFEGKPIVDEHPDDLIGPTDFKRHTVGVTLNPRRGQGSLADFMVADLLIQDADAIAAVRAGKREVSCGYDAHYESTGPGRARQTNIVGNHVALVARGRCGPSCAIGDQAMTTKPSAWDRLKAAFGSRDAKSFDAACEELEKSSKDTVPSGGTHIHMHMGTTSADPALSADGAAKDEAESGEHEEEMMDKKAKDKKAADKKSKDRKTRDDEIDARLDRIEEAVRKLAAAEAEETKESVDEEFDPAEKKMQVGDEDGAEEAEEEDEGDETADAEAEEEKEDDETMDEEAEEEKKEKKEAADKKAKDKRAKDRKTSDSAPLRGLFSETLSAAEIISPGLKLPTFDAAKPRQATMDAICLLRRRALAKMATTDDGADVLKNLTGKPKMPDGMTCDGIGYLFNSAVALTRDARLKAPAGLKAAAAKDGKKGVGQFNSTAEFNAAMRARHGGNA